MIPVFLIMMPSAMRGARMIIAAALGQLNPHGEVCVLCARALRTLCVLTLHVCTNTAPRRGHVLLLPQLAPAGWASAACCHRPRIDTVPGVRACAHDCVVRVCCTHPLHARARSRSWHRSSHPSSPDRRCCCSTLSTATHVRSVRAWCVCVHTPTNVHHTAVLILFLINMVLPLVVANSMSPKHIDLNYYLSVWGIFFFSLLALVRVFATCSCLCVPCRGCCVCACCRATRLRVTLPCQILYELWRYNQLTWAIFVAQLTTFDFYVTIIETLAEVRARVRVRVH
jgi:hypothetical protein